jgi:uncharacterized membrane protein YeaQ/YmgE (transglycosylase-associated protein family)
MRDEAQRAAVHPDRICSKRDVALADDIPLKHGHDWLSPAAPGRAALPSSGPPEKGRDSFGRISMDQPATLLGTPNIHFVSLVIIGGLAGWIAGMLIGWHHGSFTNILVGIAGSWIGSELASMAKVAVYRSLQQFLAALVGSAVLLILWRALAGRPAAAR